jgi:hypothetical protein
MALSNIELFDEFAGKIFGQLYESFPVPKELISEEFVPNTYGKDGDAGVTLFFRKQKVFFSTIAWLQSAGYTSSPDERSGFTKDVVLTAKGLEVLKAIPDSLKSGPTIGEQLAEATKEEGKEQVKLLVKEALSLGVKLIGPIIGIS